MSVAKFLAAALKEEGTPYIWAGKGDAVVTPKGLRPHGWSGHVFDCSGLVTWALKEAGWFDLRASHNANVLMHELKPTEGEPNAGDLCFYGIGDHATHVEILTEDGRKFGAIGGHKGTTQPEPGKCVRFRKTDRFDLIAWRRNPLHA